MSLYRGGFIPTSPLTNVLQSDDDGGGSFLSLITRGLSDNPTYVAVFSTFFPLAVGSYTGRLSSSGEEVYLTGRYGGSIAIQSGKMGIGTFNTPGEFRLGMNYTQGKHSTLLIKVAGGKAGQFDRLTVGGQADLDGTLQIVTLPGEGLRRGTKLTFLTAELGVNGRFSDVTGSTLLIPKVRYEDKAVSLEVPTLSSYIRGRSYSANETAVASALDSTSYSGHTLGLNTFIDHLLVRDLKGALNELAPEELTSIFAISTSLAVVQQTNLQRRTDDLRQGSTGFNASGLAMQGSGPSYSGSFEPAAARPQFRTGASGPTGMEVKESKELLPPDEKRWGAFLTGTGEWVDVDGGGNARGYDLNTGGFTLGLDYRITPNFALGIAAGYAGTSADLTNGGKVWANGGKIGLYGTYFTGGFYVDAAVNGGYNSYDTKRVVFGSTARGSTDGGELNTLIGAGYDWKVGALTIGPTATFQYTLVGTDGYTERGSLAPLEISSRNAESVRSTFGLKATADLHLGGLVIRPEVRASWQHEYGDSSYGLDASFANGDNFLVNGPETGRDSLLLGAGAAVALNDRTSAYLYYDGELFRDKYERHSVSGGVRVAF